MTLNISLPSEDILREIGSAQNKQLAQQKKRQIEVRILKQKIRKLLRMSGHKNRYRTEEYVAKAYGQKWQHRHEKGEVKSRTTQIPVEFGNECFLVDPTVLRKLHTMRVAGVIEKLKPTRVLDVGCGNGERLLILSAIFPDVYFTGIDLTKEGIAIANSIKAAGKLPTSFNDLGPTSVNANTPIGKNVDFFCGSARQMPFEDDAFDLVYTSLALEQMNLIIDDVVSEIQRVSQRWALLYEAFSEFNRGLIQRTYIDVEEYFAMSIKSLEKQGWHKVSVDSGMPQKTYMATPNVLFEVK